MQHIVMFSGGIGSWAAAKRVAAQHGTADMVLLFADTRSEDEDTYRWLADAAANVGVPLTRLDSGRDVWQVFHDRRYLGNTRVDPCSEELKREPTREWVTERYHPEDATLYLGFDWTERHRIDRTRHAWIPYPVQAPMAERPYLTKLQMLTQAESEGIAPQRLYTLGFKHANCGAFCVKAGIGHYLHLLRVWPERYAEYERREEEFRVSVGKDVSVLRDRIGGDTRPLTFRRLRERVEAEPRSCDMFSDEWGGCGCFAASG